MQKKGDFHIDTARKQFLQAGIVILLVVVLVGVLLYVEPGQKVGKAVDSGIGEAVGSHDGAAPNTDDTCPSGYRLVTTKTLEGGVVVSREKWCCDTSNYCAASGLFGIGRCFALGSILVGNPFATGYCAESGSTYSSSLTSAPAWIECDAFTEGQTTEDGRYICLGESWVVKELCPSDTGFTSARLGDDEDLNGKADCADLTCYDDPLCEGEICATGKEVVWSNLPGEDDPPTRIGCCAVDQCQSNSVGCVGYDTTPLTSSDSICGNDNDWDKCGTGLNFNKHNGEFSDGGDYVCENEAWKLVCKEETKYRITRTGRIDQVCDGRNWRTCASLEFNPILNPNVKVSCNLGIISVQEYNCNNGLDDDNDGTTDGFDADDDCSAPLTYILGKTHYEIVVKAGDLITYTLRTR